MPSEFVGISDANDNKATVVGGALSVTSSGGSTSSNQGTPNTTANAWPVKVTDGTNTATVSAASALKVDGSAVTQPVSGTVTSNQGTAAAVGSSWPVLLTDGVDTANIIVAPTAGGGNRVAVGTGSVTATSTLAAVTTNSTGTSVDLGCARDSITVVAVATGSPTAGTLTLELSIDNVTFVTSTATASITAAGTYSIFSTGRAARYVRASLTGLTGSITLTANIMAA